MRPTRALAIFVLGGASAMGVGARAAPDSAESDELFAFVRPGRGWTEAQVAAEAVRRAPRIAAQSARLEAAEERREVSRAGLLPRTRATARYTRLSRIDNDPLVDLGVDFAVARAGVDAIPEPATRDALSGQVSILEGLSQGVIEIPENQYAFSAELSYPVSQLFCEILPGLRASEAAAEAAAAEVEVRRNDVALEAVEALLNHARARSSEVVSERALARAKVDLQAAEARLAAETGTEPDVLRLKARLADAERAYAARRADVIASAEAVRTLAGIEGEGPLPVGIPLPEPPPPPGLVGRQEAIQRAYGDRPELKAVARLIEVRQSSLQAEWGSTLPTLGVSARVDVANPNNLFVPPGDDFRTSWNLSAVLSWSPDRSYAQARSAAAAAAELEAVRADELALKDRVRVEVVDALARWSAAGVELQAARRGVEAAAAGLAATRQGYRLGVFDVTDLLEAERTLERAQLGLIDAGVALRVRQARLTRSLGDRLWAQEDAVGS